MNSKFTFFRTSRYRNFNQLAIACAIFLFSFENASAMIGKSCDAFFRAAAQLSPDNYGKGPISVTGENQLSTMWNEFFLPYRHDRLETLIGWDLFAVKPPFLSWLRRGQPKVMGRVRPPKELQSLRQEFISDLKVGIIEGSVSPVKLLKFAQLRYNSHYYSVAFDELFVGFRNEDSPAGYAKYREFVFDTHKDVLELIPLAVEKIVENYQRFSYAQLGAMAEDLQNISRAAIGFPRAQNGSYANLPPWIKMTPKLDYVNPAIEVLFKLALLRLEEQVKTMNQGKIEELKEYFIVDVKNSQGTRFEYEARYRFSLHAILILKLHGGQ